MDHLVSPSRKSHKDLPALYRSSSDRYTTRNGLLYYTAVASDTPRVVVPTHNDLRLRIMYECHDAPPSGHRGREKSCLTVSRDFLLTPPVPVRVQVHSCLRGVSTGEA